MAKAYKTILVEKDDGITTVKFNRPEKRNAMNPTLHREMFDVLSDLEFDDETQVLVITGQGESFSAGQDLKEYFYETKDTPRQSQEARRMSHGWRHQKLHYFPKPTIAAVNGWCFGGAFTVVASCDVAIAADEAVFGLSEVNFGQLAGGLVTKVVSGLMLPRQALYYIMSGEKFDGKRSVEIGFTTMSVPRAQLARRTREVAENFKAKDPKAIQAAKEAFKAVDIRAMPFEDAWYWLKARERQLTHEQKGNTWVDQGIGDFMQKKFRPGLEARPRGEAKSKK